MRNDSAAKFFQNNPMVWSCFSQVRDCVDNDNMSDAMKVQMARDMQRWAASRADSPAFAPFCFAAAAEAQKVLNQFRPRAV